MDLQEIIDSGLIESYCMGVASAKEVVLLESLCREHPEIRKELEKVQRSLESQSLNNTITPSASVRISVLQKVYEQQAGEDYPPLIHGKMKVELINNWIKRKGLIEPRGNFENLMMIDLPCTATVINFAVAAKKGHEPEIHENYIEYFYVISGSCTMNFEGRVEAFKAGDIISIPPNVLHTAEVTSPEPMFALVQRQMCA